MQSSDQPGPVLQPAALQGAAPPHSLLSVAEEERPTAEAAKAVAQAPTRAGRYLRAAGDTARYSRPLGRASWLGSARHGPGMPCIPLPGPASFHLRVCKKVRNACPPCCPACPAWKHTTHPPAGRPTPPATRAFVGHGPQRHQVAQGGEQQAQIEGACGVVTQLLLVRLLLHRAGRAGGGRAAGWAWRRGDLSGKQEKEGLVPVGARFFFFLKGSRNGSRDGGTGVRRRRPAAQHQLGTRPPHSP